MGSIVIPDPPCGTDACAETLRELAAAAERRDTIGMAKGILMVRTPCSSDAAFDVMRSASMRENVKVFDIAQRLVTNIDRPAVAQIDPA